MKSTEELIKEYERHYMTTMPPKVSRLPMQLQSEEDTYCRLRAIYKLQVESREHVMILDDNVEAKLHSVAKWLCCSSQPGLLLMGTLGNGKSTMLQTIYRLFNRVGVVIGDAQDIFTYYKDNQGSLRYWNERLLLIDDLGVEPAKCITYGEVSYPMSRLLLHRYDKRLTTVIATNLSFDAIQERYGDRVADRMVETFDAIGYNAESYRKNNML